MYMIDVAWVSEKGSAGIRENRIGTGGVGKVGTAESGTHLLSGLCMLLSGTIMQSSSTLF